MFSSLRGNRPPDVKATYGTIVPSLPYLVKIDSKLGVPVAGDTISRVKIAKAAGLDVGSSAFTNVLNQWRKRLFNCHGVVLTPDYRGSFIVATDAEKIKVAGKLKRTAVTYVTKSVEIAASTDSAKLCHDDQIAKMLLCDSMNKAKLLLAANLN